MLPFALLLATATASPKPQPPQPARSACSSGQNVVFSPARTCSALEVSGNIDAAAVTLDPAFDVTVPPAQLTRPGRNIAILTGYSGDGRTVFTFPFEATGPFHAFVPLAPAAASSLERLRLSTYFGTVERSATTHGDPDAEVVALDDSRVVIAWNAHSFPAIRLLQSAGAAAPEGIAAGTSTYEQATLHDSLRRVVVSFSDGVRSATRSFHVFGR